MGHGFLKKVNFYFIFSEKINFPGKMPLKFSNNAQCVCLTKMLEKNASIMYKSLDYSPSLVTRFHSDEGYFQFQLCRFESQKPYF